MGSRQAPYGWPTFPQRAEDSGTGQHAREERKASQVKRNPLRERKITQVIQGKLSQMWTMKKGFYQFSRQRNTLNATRNLSCP